MNYNFFGFALSRLLCTLKSVRFFKIDSRRKIVETHHLLVKVFFLQLKKNIFSVFLFVKTYPFTLKRKNNENLLTKI